MCVGGCVQECDTVAQTSVSFTSGYVLLAPTGPAVPAVQNTESLHEQERTNTHTHTDTDGQTWTLVSSWDVGLCIFGE